MKKRIIVLLVLMVCMLAGCREEEKHSYVSNDEDKKIQIGMSFDSFVIERWNREKEIFVSAASAAGAEVNVQNANGDLETQKEQIKYLINKGMDVIVIIAVDSNGLSDIVKEAKEAGIKIIAYDRLINDADIDLYISFDNRQVGVLMAEALMKATDNSGNYLMLSGPTTDNNVNMIEDGFRSTIKNYMAEDNEPYEQKKEASGNNIEDTVDTADGNVTGNVEEDYSDNAGAIQPDSTLQPDGKNGISITGYMNAINWKSEYVYEYLERNLDIVREADGIMCGNDNLATMAIRFLSEKGLAGKIPVVGQDADLEACQHIVEGTQLMTVYKSVEKLAQKAAECAIELADGNAAVTLSSRTMPNGKYNCPYISLTPVSVDKDNMEEVVIADGFHLKEEVYLNVAKK